MRSNSTQFRKFDAGCSKVNAVKTTRKRFSSDLSNDYKLALQLYCLSKQAAAKKKELEYKAPALMVSGRRVISKSSYPIFSSIASFLNVNIPFYKKMRQQITLITE